MITRIKVANYRCFKTLDFRPNEKLNIIVGDNDAGKSTLLEVISLVLSGRVRGRWAAEDLNPYWFNHEVARQYFHELANGGTPELPEIDLEIFLSSECPGGERLKGMQNSESEDCPGLRMRVRPDPGHLEELKEYLAEEELPRLIPTDLFAVTWRDFSGELVSRQPRGLGVALISSNTAATRAGVDYKLRELIRDFVSPQESAKIALAHRKAKANITARELNIVNERIEESGESFGVRLQMDQGASSSWSAAVAPHIEDTPFSMLGQGRQVATKIALAMSRGVEQTQLVLAEEPENHFSHTQMQRVITQISSLAGDRQVFITTHSSFVLNRLGLGSIHLLHESNLVHFDTPRISKDTIAYFQKQPGYDTLRLVTATKVVVVEGPSDEMLFNLAYKKLKGVEPRSAGIDVIALGTRGKRALELGAALDRKMAVLRDNDGKPPSHWEKGAQKWLKKGVRELFVGETSGGHTLEPQVARLPGNDKALRALFSLDVGVDLEEFLISDKTEWAWQVAQNELDLAWPQYFLDAIEFIDDN